MCISKYKDISNFKKAMTHASYCYENNIDVLLCNERLEFLGDAVLKTCVSTLLFEKYPNFQEGELSKLHSEIVSNKTLTLFAQKLGLSEHLVLGAQEEKMGGRSKSSILSCAFEALLGAIFLEYGILEVRSFLEDNFSEEIMSIKISNYKALLQEYTQGKDGTLPVYELLLESGQAHSKTFETGVYYNGELLGKGAGKSKKEAQQNAAQAALIKLGVNE